MRCSLLIASALFVGAIFLPVTFDILTSKTVRRWIAVVRRRIFGETFKVFAEDVLLAEVRTRRPHVELKVSPGVVCNGMGPARPVRYTVDSPPNATARVTVYFVVDPPVPPYPNGAYR